MNNESHHPSDMQHPTAPRDPLREPISFADLVGVPWQDGAWVRKAAGAPLDCYGIVREGLMRLGVELPANPAVLLTDAWREWGRQLAVGAHLQRGDVVRIRTVTGGDHLGLCISPWEFLHSISPAARGGLGPQPGSRIDKLATYRRANLIAAAWRPLDLERSGLGG
jgi:hypothetical protein